MAADIFGLFQLSIGQLHILCILHLRKVLVVVAVAAAVVVVAAAVVVSYPNPG